MENTNQEEKETNAKNHSEEQVEAQGEAHEERVEEEVAQAEKKHEDVEYKEKYYYLAAEMQNMQRRFDKEKESLLKYGSEKILRDLLDVVDNFERTLGFIRNDNDDKVKNIAIGIDMINKQFMETLQKHGLVQVDALGKMFDPNFHEALAQQPSEGKEDMEVIQVHQNGYKLNERLIRPAKVVVVKN
jgi:molecular chaperone GrpE